MQKNDYYKLTKTELKILIEDLGSMLGESPRTKKEQVIWNKRLNLVNKLENMLILYDSKFNLNQKNYYTR